jgi:hypothetical protein
MESLARIVKIDHVIQEGARAVGYDRLSSQAEATLMSKLRQAYPANVWA